MYSDVIDAYSLSTIQENFSDCCVGASRGLCVGGLEWWGWWSMGGEKLSLQIRAGGHNNYSELRVGCQAKKYMKKWNLQNPKYLFQL